MICVPGHPLRDRFQKLKSPGWMKSAAACVPPPPTREMAKERPGKMASSSFGSAPGSTRLPEAVTQQAPGAGDHGA